MQDLYLKVINFLNTMRGYVFAAIVGIAAIVFLGATGAASILYERLFSENVLESATEISRQSFDTLSQSLAAGASHQQIEALANVSKQSFSNIDRLDVYRSAKYSSLGSSVLPAVSKDVRVAMASGNSVVTEGSNHIRFAYPVKAQQACLKCHADAQEGDVLAVIASQHRLEPVTPKVRIYYVGLFLLLGTVVLLATTAISAFAARRIKLSTDLFRDKIGKINSVKDFNQLDIDNVDFGFEEFNQTFDHVHELVERIRQVAVDKNVLEFEIRLLEKFIITSNVVKDWREFICSLLLDINPIIDAYALVTIFRIEEEAYECEVFWRSTPSENSRVLFEGFLRKQLEGNPMLHGSVLLNVVHNIADKDSVMSEELSGHEIELQTKSLVLDTPRIGGIVGIGVQSTQAQDEVRSMVIGSILTTLLNLVGSVKAIYKYTKDLEYYATRDPLTNIYNQRMFWELLRYEVGRSKRHSQHFAVMMLDLDNFKTINDRFGHQFGDSFLQAFTEILKGMVRDGDLLARYGGDEFCIILPEANDTQAHMIAQRIGEKLEAFVMPAPDGHRVKTTVSAGIAVYPQHGEDPKDLFLVADNMMYKAKRSGKNAIAIPNEDEMAEVFRKAGEKSIMVQNALDQERIVPFFQPICNAATGDIQIHELLMRIQMDDHIIAANDFIEEAESMGIVHKMDYQLIEKAFQQMKEQDYQGMLFVNLSPKALIVGEFVGRVQRLAKESGIAPNRIVFEITERETVSNLSLLEKFVLDIKMQGFSFAIDDFGSGYSSFQYIKRFPVDYIKIEGEFIRNMLVDEVYLAFIKSIVTLAKELKVKTIAEYVEDADILAAVSKLGIDYAQGYHISRPAQRLHVSGAQVAS